MPIVGHGDQTNIKDQTNFFGNAEDLDIRVQLISERDVIDIDIGGPPPPVSVEVHNLGGAARELSLRVEGVDSNLGTVVPDKVSVNPGKLGKAQLVLSCTSTQPEAGTRQLVVRATDTDPKGKSKLVSKSNAKTLNVPARPRVGISSFEPPASTIRDPDTYPMTVRVYNTGNTRLSASLRYPDPGWIVTHVSPDSGDRVVAPDQIGFGAATEDLGPGEFGDIAIEVEIADRPLNDRRWVLPLMVVPSRGDAPYLDTFVFHQTGVLSELPHVLADVRERLRAWVARPVSSRRGVLVAAFLAMLIVGGVLGLVVSPDPAPGAESGSSPATTAPTSRVSSPPSVSPQPPFVYEDLPCAPGTVVVFFATVREPDADAKTQQIAYYEHNRIWLMNLGRANGDPELPDLVHISAWSPECPTAGLYASDNKENHFIWYGPVAAGVKERICETLRKPEGDRRHCFAHTMVR